MKLFILSISFIAISVIKAIPVQQSIWLSTINSDPEDNQVKNIGRPFLSALLPGLPETQSPVLPPVQSLVRLAVLSPVQPPVLPPVYPNEPNDLKKSKQKPDHHKPTFEKPHPYSHPYPLKPTDSHHPQSSTQRPLKPIGSPHPSSQRPLKPTGSSHPSSKRPPKPTGSPILFSSQRPPKPINLPPLSTTEESSSATTSKVVISSEATTSTAVVSSEATTLEAVESSEATTIALDTTTIFTSE